MRVFNWNESLAVNGTSTVTLVGSGDLGGASLSHSFDGNVYLVDAGDELLLIDSGAGVDIGPLLARVDEAGFDRGAIRHLLLTHKHSDHAGGAAQLQKELGLKVYASEECANVLATADERLASIDLLKRTGAYPADYNLNPCRVDEVVGEGHVIEIGNCRVEVVSTPGHSSDHLSFLCHSGNTRNLFVGDALLPGGTVALQGTYDASITQTFESIEKLSSLEFDGFYPGHGLFSVRRGKRHVEAAMELVRKGVIPPNFGF